MRSKRTAQKKSVSHKVDWVYHPDPTAEQEFWRLYFALSLELLVQDSQTDKRPGS